MVNDRKICFIKFDLPNVLEQSRMDFIVDNKAVGCAVRCCNGALHSVASQQPTDSLGIVQTGQTF